MLNLFHNNKPSASSLVESPWGSVRTKSFLIHWQIAWDVNLYNITQSKVSLFKLVNAKNILIQKFQKWKYVVAKSILCSALCAMSPIISLFFSPTTILNSIYTWNRIFLQYHFQCASNRCAVGFFSQLLFFNFYFFLLLFQRHQQ